MLGISTRLPPPANFFNTPLAAVFMAPFAKLPLRTRIAVFDIVSLGMLAGSALIVLRLLPSDLGWDRRTLLVVLGVGSLPAMSAIAQWDSLMLLATLLAFLLLREAPSSTASPARHRSLRRLGAGLLLSLLLLKPQVAWLLVPALLAARSWRVLAGFVLGGAANLASGMLTVGPAQTLRIVSFITTQTPRYAGS
jgi:hypothetical protein